MKGYGTTTFGELNAERYDAICEEAMTTETRGSVEALAELAAGGKVLELAIGAGRVALPLAERGLNVHGIEGSEAMLAALRGKPGGGAIPVAIGDMSEVRVAGLPLPTSNQHGETLIAIEQASACFPSQARLQSLSALSGSAANPPSCAAVPSSWSICVTKKSAIGISTNTSRKAACTPNVSIA